MFSSFRLNLLLRSRACAFSAGWTSRPYLRAASWLSPPVASNAASIATSAANSGSESLDAATIADVAASVFDPTTTAFLAAIKAVVTATNSSVKMASAVRAVVAKLKISPVDSSDTAVQKVIDAILKPPAINPPPSGIIIPRLSVHQELLRIVLLDSIPKMHILEGFSGQGKTTAMNMFLKAAVVPDNQIVPRAPVACRISFRGATASTFFSRLSIGLGTTITSVEEAILLLNKACAAVKLSTQSYRSFEGEDRPFLCEPFLWIDDFHCCFDDDRPNASSEASQLMAALVEFHHPVLITCSDDRAFRYLSKLSGMKARLYQKSFPNLNLSHIIASLTQPLIVSSVFESLGHSDPVVTETTQYIGCSLNDARAVVDALGDDLTSLESVLKTTDNFKSSEHVSLDVLRALNASQTSAFKGSISLQTPVTSVQRAEEITAAWIVFDALMAANIANKDVFTVCVHDRVAIDLSNTVFVERDTWFYNAINRLVDANLLTRPDVVHPGVVAFKRRILLHAWLIARTDASLIKARSDSERIVSFEFKKLISQVKELDLKTEELEFKTEELGFKTDELMRKRELLQNEQIEARVQQIKTRFFGQPVGKERVRFRGAMFWQPVRSEHVVLKDGTLQTRKTAMGTIEARLRIVDHKLAHSTPPDTMALSRQLLVISEGNGPSHVERMVIMRHLLTAAIAGNSNDLRYWLSTCHVTQSMATEVLCEVAVLGSAAVAEVLFRAGAQLDVPYAPWNWQTPLHSACEGNHADLCHFLVENLPTRQSAYICTRRGLTPFDLALRNQDGPKLVAELEDVLKTRFGPQH